MANQLRKTFIQKIGEKAIVPLALLISTAKCGEPRVDRMNFAPDASISTLDASINPDRKIEPPLPCTNIARISPTSKEITIGLIVDDSSEYNKPDQYYCNLVQAANQKILAPLINMEFKVINLVHLKSNDYGSDSNGTLGLQQAYFAMNNIVPEYLAVLTRNDNFAATYGGYQGQPVSYAQDNIRFTNPFLNQPFCNRLESPVYGNKVVFSSFNDTGAMIYLCGYPPERFTPGGWNLPPVSSTSINGQCRNQSGITCNFEDGASRCSNWRQSEMELGEPPVNNITELDLQFNRMVIVHELGHSFGNAGNADHYGTPECAMRIATRNPISLPCQSFDSCAGICPDIWEIVRDGYNQCK